MKIEIGDKAAAEAIRIANEKLNAAGWRYSASEIGEVAAQILLAMQKEISKG